MLSPPLSTAVYDMMRFEVRYDEGYKELAAEPNSSRRTPYL